MALVLVAAAVVPAGAGSVTPRSSDAVLRNNITSADNTSRDARVEGDVEVLDPLSYTGELTVARGGVLRVKAAFSAASVVLEAGAALQTQAATTVTRLTVAAGAGVEATGGSLTVTALVSAGSLKLDGQAVAVTDATLSQSASYELAVSGSADSATPRLAVAGVLRLDGPAVITLSIRPGFVFPVNATMTVASLGTVLGDFGFVRIVHMDRTASARSLLQESGVADYGVVRCTSGSGCVVTGMSNRGDIVEEFSDSAHTHLFIGLVSAIGICVVFALAVAFYAVAKAREHDNAYQAVKDRESELALLQTRQRLRRKRDSLGTTRRGAGSDSLSPAGS
ncbi:uncharacterized protein AMSG_00487 [Thecamonas trahens ATCC 50062]|uniref:Auto-transporter adhesin head GIN domain-containing protein n=1 Tax=Thecamonas trahens ATCC 50062 TaxID=461836 RepID=A0A0L0D8K7_THETB|nr:hypothetical protein AMSG_00487 [Thecamonas trahens ATCC 50062]KNC48712.1 hypothetical protein AMSG_00487 [Thecamonas trahens ATCC 50062]|eukprot:XP_013762764.1 hypothetical protein AMSG_00487 [Thecamonas trahens ATCC 50062]